VTTWTSGVELGPYELLAKIGEGGMGEVWRARDTRLDRTVAIKRLKGEHGSRFQQEARAIAALNHPHICQIHDIGPDYLVLEYIEGTPLASQIGHSNSSLQTGVLQKALRSRAHDTLNRAKPPLTRVTSTKGIPAREFDGLMSNVHRSRLLQPFLDVPLCRSDEV
jgi:eukaryotic-like serine/threonine-protein kinase